MEKTWQWLCAPPEQAPQPCYTIYPSSIGSVFVYIGKGMGGKVSVFWQSELENISMSGEWRKYVVEVVPPDEEEE